MGWFHPWGATKKDIIRERTERKTWQGKDEQGKPDEYEMETLAHAVRGNVLWMVKVTRKNGEEVARFIECDLLRSDGEQWGYKDMEESMHPFYYSCPVSYLAMVPEESPITYTNAEWRKLVREYHAKRTKKVEVGKTYQLVGVKYPKTVRVTHVHGMGCKGVGDDGRLYHVAKKFIGELVS